MLAILLGADDFLLLTTYHLLFYPLDKSRITCCQYINFSP